MEKIAFIGLGVMGFPMAGFLKNAGYETTVYNRTTVKAQRWQEKYQGQVALTPCDAAKDCDLVMACVGSDDDLREVTLGETGAFAGMKQGAIFVDHTTTSATVARELHTEAQKQGLAFVDAPVSGGQSGAENGTLTIMCGAEQNIFQKVKPILSSYAKSIVRIGEVGSGQLCKMMNQICIAGLVQGLSEAVNFGQRAGLDLEAVFDAISQGAAGSWQMQNRFHTMSQDKFDFGFAVDLMRKDLGLCLQEAKQIQARLPVTALVDQFYAEVQDRSGGRWDTSSLVRLLQSSKT